MSDGLHKKYRVEKISDPTGKHDNCRYFVLDPQHDPIARIALLAYADEAWNTGNRALGDELTEWAHECEQEGDVTEEPCCRSHHYVGCADGAPGCCSRCPINPSSLPPEGNQS